MASLQFGSTTKGRQIFYEYFMKKVTKRYNLWSSAVVQHFKFQFADSAARRNSGRLCCRAEEVVRVLCIWGALHEMLRSRLVWGIEDSHIQHRLLAESSLTFVKAMEIAQAMELATHDLKDLHFALASSTSVHKLQGRNHLYPKRFQVPPPLLPLWWEALCCTLPVQD